MLALSSLSRRSLYVGIAWVGLWVIGSAVAGVLGLIHHETLRNRVMHEEMSQAQGQLSSRPRNGRDSSLGNLHWTHIQERTQQEEAQAAPTNWRLLFSYTMNFQRLGEAVLGSDAAWVQIGRAREAARVQFGTMLGATPAGWAGGGDVEPANERRLADQYVPQYPWTWSAYVLAGLWGLSLWILGLRVKSLDRLR
jgi:hypothetical protein